uniref:ORFA, ORFB, homocitrate synthase (nifV), nitrogenase reductase (nifH), and nitrogenase alpha-subunit (nifD) genes, and nitrogenase beta-subunit (nifK) n=1 Tax=Frankia sp. TaxID=1855 RepID=Q47925_9ACTN|nr:ORFA [Frankia sp.]
MEVSLRPGFRPGSARGPRRSRGGREQGEDRGGSAVSSEHDRPPARDRTGSRRAFTRGGAGGAVGPFRRGASVAGRGRPPGGGQGRSRAQSRQRSLRMDRSSTALREASRTLAMSCDEFRRIRADSGRPRVADRLDDLGGRRAVLEEQDLLVLVGGQFHRQVPQADTGEVAAEDLPYVRAEPAVATDLPQQADGGPEDSVVPHHCRPQVLPVARGIGWHTDHLGLRHLYRPSRQPTHLASVCTDTSSSLRAGGRKHHLARSCPDQGAYAAVIYCHSFVIHKISDRPREVQGKNARKVSKPLRLAAQDDGDAIWPCRLVRTPHRPPPASKKGWRGSGEGSKTPFRSLCVTD